MIDLAHYHGKHVAVLGLGASGKASADALAAAGAELVVWDDSAPDRYREFTMMPVIDWPWEKLECIVMSPGVALTHPQPHAIVALAAAHNVAITSDVCLLMEACPDAIYVGITGTNGKSTTTALITHIVQSCDVAVQCGGNIGIAALALQPLQAGDVCVLELSSYQLDLFDRGRLNIACLLNITPDHLDRHGGMDGYIAAKEHIFARQLAHDVAIIAIDDKYTQHVASRQAAPILVSVDADKAADVVMDGTELVDCTAYEPRRYDISLAPALRGVHNHQNAITAYMACRALNLASDDIYAAMLSYGGLAHRMERVGVIDGVLCINDSKATNADAARQSLQSYDNIYWIVGGVAKAGGIASLIPLFPHVAKAYIIGETPDDYASTCAAAGLAYDVCHTIDEAVRKAFCDARGQQNAVMLCAPSAASFDQFANFEKRGDAFKAAIATLQH